MKFWAEIQRRHVIRIVAAYLIAAWLLVQVAVTIEAPLGLPDWFDTMVIVLMAIGFPIVAVLAWAFDITAEGIKRTPPAAEAKARPPAEAAPVGPAIAASAAPAPAAPPVSSPSIAVLPFANMSADPDQEYFSDGLSEELLNQLAQIKELRVAARTSSFYFKGKDVDLKEVAAKLGVSHVLEGSVRKAGDQLRITAQLISAQDGYHLWSETYARTLDDVFAIQDEIARAVADALSVTLGLGESTLVAGGTRDVEAYDLYLRAQALVRQAGATDLLRAEELFRQALALDPEFALAWTALSEALHWIAVFVPEHVERAEREQVRAVDRALALAPDLWATHYAFAMREMYVRRNWLEAERALARARELAPASEASLDMHLGFFLLYVGRAADSIALFESARNKDPLNLQPVSVGLQSALAFAGRDAEARAEYERGKDLIGNHEGAEAIEFWSAVARGDPPDRVKAQLRRLLDHEVIRMPVFWDVLELWDEPEAALAKLRAASEDPAYANGPMHWQLGAMAAQLGDADLAFTALHRAFIDFTVRAVFILWQPKFAELRPDSRFKDLVRDIGLVDYWRATGNWGDFARPLDSKGGGDDDFECF